MSGVHTNKVDNTLLDFVSRVNAAYFDIFYVVAYALILREFL